MRLDRVERVPRSSANCESRTKSRMRENRSSGLGRGSARAIYGEDVEALPEETGSEQIGFAYGHGASARIYNSLS